MTCGKTGVRADCAGVRGYMGWSRRPQREAGRAGGRAGVSKSCVAEAASGRAVGEVVWVADGSRMEKKGWLGRTVPQPLEWE